MVKDCMEEIVDSYNFAKEKGFDSIVITISTSEGEYTISEHEDGFVTDPLNYVYSNIEEIAEDLTSMIVGNVLEIRIE